MTEETAEPGWERPADRFSRFLAKLIDFLAVGVVYAVLPSLGIYAGALYLLLADGIFPGQSPGKRLLGLRVLRSGDGASATFRESAIRNFPLAVGLLCLLIPYLGWVILGAVLLVEGFLVLASAEGIRLGDELAATRVVESPAPAEGAMG